MTLPRPVSAVLGRLARPTRLVMVAQALVLTALVAGLAGWTVLDRTVTLEVDGAAQDVRILGSEVSDVLAAADVELDERDLVSPAVGETVADGETVVVRYARPLTVADPAGDEQTYWTTELTVDAALSAIGMRHEDAWLSASRSASIGRSGLSLTLSQPKDLVLVHDGQTLPMTSASPTVADLLEEHDVALGAEDRLTPAAETVLTAGQTVTVQRVATEDVTETVAVEAPVRTVEDANMYKGESDVQAAGAAGEQVVTFRVVTVDGQVESREETGRATTREPQERVVVKGTKARPAPVRTPSAPAATSSAPAAVPSGGGSGLNWAALAACESGGNPSIVSSNGLYHGLYQFNVGTWRSVGGSGVPSQASAAEQTSRAQILYSQRGAQPWPHCGPRLFR